MSKDTSGPAFPTPRYERGDMYSLGMTLRDYFAAKAMQGGMAVLSSGRRHAESEGGMTDITRITTVSVLPTSAPVPVTLPEPVTLDAIRKIIREELRANAALEAAARQALEALELLQNAIYNIGGEHVTGWGYANDAADSAEKSITALKAALAEPQEPVAAVAKNATAQFDHAIGADRFKVVRGAFWWHVLIGDSTKEHGKFHSRAGAEQMAADLLREFRNGAFVQCTTTPQRPPLTDEEIDKAVAQERDALLDHIYEYGTLAEGVLERIRRLARAVERKVRGEKE